MLYFSKMDKKSFTLSELLLAVAILAMSLGAILLALVQCFLLNEANRNLTRALTHAEYILEDIKNTNFENIKTKIENGDWDWDSSEIVEEGLTPLNNENIDTSVNGTTLLEIEVTVTWKDRGLRDRSTSLETLIAQP